MTKYVDSIVNYFKDAKLELMKVSWPSKHDLTRYSVIVIAASIIVAASFGALDFGLAKGLNKLIDLVS
ncbi:MAG: preprotein translocase subunit SecE [bacterium]